MITLKAHGKINIGLHVLGKRKDGYHNIETIFHEVNVFDEIELEENESIKMNADSILIPIDETNLCFKAAQIIQSNCKVDKGVLINLKKNIPIGAGLGGGSSDAASVLLGLNKLWDLKLSNDKLSELATQIGADVPFFIEGKTAYATGKGEILDYFKLKIPYWIVIITPLIHISTAWAYTHLKLSADKKDTDLKSKVSKNINNPEKLTTIAKNDFEESTIKSFPEIGNIKNKLIGAGSVFTLMSGSGSSVFGFFEDEIKAKNAIDLFPKNYQSSITPPDFKSR